MEFHRCDLWKSWRAELSSLIDGFNGFSPSGKNKFKHHNYFQKVPLRFKFVISQFIRALFPRECLGCGKLDTFICSACLGSIPIREAGREKVRCQDFLDKVLIVSFYSHPLVPLLIEHFKYRGRQQLALALTRLFTAFIKRNKLCIDGAI